MEVRIYDLFCNFLACLSSESKLLSWDSWKLSLKRDNINCCFSFIEGPLISSLLWQKGKERPTFFHLLLIHTAALSQMERVQISAIVVTDGLDVIGKQQLQRLTKILQAT